MIYTILIHIIPLSTVHVKTLLEVVASSPIEARIFSGLVRAYRPSPGIRAVRARWQAFHAGGQDVKALTSSAKICQDLPVVSQDFHPFSDFTGKQQGFHGYIWGYNMIHDIIWDKVINHDHRHHLGLSKNIQTLGMRCMHQHIAVQMAKMRVLRTWISVASLEAAPRKLPRTVLQVSGSTCSGSWRLDTSIHHRFEGWKLPFLPMVKNISKKWFSCAPWFGQERIRLGESSAGSSRTFDCETLKKIVVQFETMVDWSKRVNNCSAMDNGRFCDNIDRGPWKSTDSCGSGEHQKWSTTWSEYEPMLYKGL